MSYHFYILKEFLLALFFVVLSALPINLFVLILDHLEGRRVSQLIRVSIAPRILSIKA